MNKVKRFFRNAGTHSLVITVIILVHIAAFAIIGLIVSSTEVAYGGENGSLLNLSNINDSVGFWVSLAMFIVAFLGIMGTITYRLFLTKQIKKSIVKKSSTRKVKR